MITITSVKHAKHGTQLSRAVAGTHHL